MSQSAHIDAADRRDGMPRRPEHRKDAALAQGVMRAAAVVEISHSRVMSRGSSPTSSGANSSLIIAVSAWFAAMLPTCALASPQPVTPHAVSMRTNVASNEVVRPKSLVCCCSSGIGMCTQ